MCSCALCLSPRNQMDQSPNTVTCNNSRSQRTNSAGVFIFRPSQQKCKNTWKRNHRTKKKEATGRVPAKCNNRTCLCLCRWVGRSRKKKARIVTLTLKKVHKFCQAVMRTFKEAAEKGVSKNACGMRGPHRQSLTMRLAEKCNGTYEMRKLSRKGQRKKCNAVLLEACAHCEDNTTSIKETHTQYLEWINHTKHKNGTHYHANGASALRHRFIGGGPAPVWTSISSTSPSSFAASATPSTPVCFLCSRCAPDYVPCAFQEIYSAKCSSCKRANCNQCGKWEGSSFFCKWCFDEGITPSVEAMQSWKAAQQTHTRKPSIELEHAKRLRQYALDMRGAMPVRFQGGGTEELQCFMCLAYKSAYVSKQLSDEYVSHCYTCGRGACDSHGSWEAGHFHCALCHATDDGLLAEVKDTFAVRCLSKTFQNQRLLHTNEEAFNDFLLTLCTGGINRPRGMGNYDEQGLKVPPTGSSRRRASLGRRAAASRSNRTVLELTHQMMQKRCSGRVGFQLGTAGKNCANVRQSAVVLQSQSDCATLPSRMPLTKARPTPKHCRLWRLKGSCGGKRCHTV